MISFAGLGEGLAGGVVDCVGVSVGVEVGALLGVVASDGVVSGELVAVWLVWTQPASIKTSPATHAAGTTPLLTRL